MILSYVQIARLSQVCFTVHLLYSTQTILSHTDIQRGKRQNTKVITGIKFLCLRISMKCQTFFIFWPIVTRIQDFNARE